MSQIFKRFSAFYSKHLFLCNTVGSAVITSSGDAMIQKITRTESHDWDRTYKMGFVGFSEGILEHFFYLKLDKVVSTNGRKAVLKKLFVDQIIGAPIFICGFFMLCNIWEKQPEKGWSEIKSKFLQVYKVDLLLWPPAQFINFMYLPPQFRVLYVSSISVFYTAFLSYVKHED